jgi:hypothetical protein
LKARRYRARVRAALGDVRRSVRGGCGWVSRRRRVKRLCVSSERVLTRGKVEGRELWDLMDRIRGRASKEERAKGSRGRVRAGTEKVRGEESRMERYTDIEITVPR